MHSPTEGLAIGQIFVQEWGGREGACVTGCVLVIVFRLWDSNHLHRLPFLGLTVVNERILPKAQNYKQSICSTEKGSPFISGAFQSLILKSFICMLGTFSFTHCRIVSKIIWDKNVWKCLAENLIKGKCVIGSESAHSISQSCHKEQRRSRCEGALESVSRETKVRQ